MNLSSIYCISRNAKFWLSTRNFNFFAQARNGRATSSRASATATSVSAALGASDCAISIRREGGGGWVLKKLLAHSDGCKGGNLRDMRVVAAHKKRSASLKARSSASRQ